MMHSAGAVTALLLFLFPFVLMGGASPAEGAEFAPSRYDNSAPGGVAVMEVISYLHPKEGEKETPFPPQGGHLFVPLRKTDITGTVTGPLAFLTVTHSYRFSSEEHNGPVEALYRFPLPGDGAVTSCSVTFGDVRIATELKERQKAEEEYEEAKKEGKQAVLLTRETPDVFTLAVQGIRPDEEVTVKTTWVQMAEPRKGGWSLRLPLTTAPRFVRQDELSSPQSRGNPLAICRDPGHRCSLNLTFSEPCEITSPTHSILTPRGEGDKVHVTLAQGAVVPDRDFVLRWIPESRKDAPRAGLSIYEYTPEENEGNATTWFFGLLTPRTSEEIQESKPIPREVVLLVDHSGSMEGAKWKAADWAVISFLNSLQPEDRFSLGLFHNTTSWFSPAPVPATRENITRGVDYLTGNRDSGGTNLGIALEQGLRLKAPQNPGGYARHVLVITDAQVTDAPRIFRLVEKEMKKEAPRKVSILCIDAAPNDYLAREIARKGGGLARFLTSAPEESDISTALEEVLEEWGAPVLQEAALVLHTEEGARGSVSLPEGPVQKLSPEHPAALFLGDLPERRPRWVVGRLSISSPEKVRWSLESRGAETPVKPEEYALQDEAGTALKALYGARVLNRLEQLSLGGTPPETLAEELRAMGYTEAASQLDPSSTVYHENLQIATKDVMEPLLVRESLFFGIPCQATALVGVRKDVNLGTTAPVLVGNALPQGWDEGFAAPAPTMRKGFVAGAARMLKTAMPGTVMRNMAAPQAPMDSFVLESEEMEDLEKTSPSREIQLFSGTPSGEASQRLYEGKSPRGGVLSELRVTAKNTYSGKAVLLLYVGDMAEPKARIPLEGLLLQGGRRPLHIALSSGTPIRLVLENPRGDAAFPLEIVLSF